MRKIILFALIAFVISSCAYTTYNMNRGELKIAKKATYAVNYTTIVPNGVPATISYTDKDGSQQKNEFAAGGRWEKAIDMPSGTAIEFHVDVTLPKTDPAGRLVTNVKVDNKIVSEQIQTGKKVKYRFAFKLP